MGGVVEIIFMPYKVVVDDTRGGQILMVAVFLLPPMPAFVFLE
jgi:hypothetical protein